MTLGIIDTMVVIVYAVVILGMGVYFLRRQTSTEEYFLGGRKMHWLIVGISIQAMLMSTISYLSVIKNGFGFAFQLADWADLRGKTETTSSQKTPCVNKINLGQSNQD